MKDRNEGISPAANELMDVVFFFDLRLHFKHPLSKFVSDHDNEIEFLRI